MDVIARWHSRPTSETERFFFLLLCAVIFCSFGVAISATVCDVLGVSNRRPSDAVLSVFVAGKSQFWVESKEKVLFVAFSCASALAVWFAPAFLEWAMRLTPAQSFWVKLSPAIVCCFVAAVLVLARDYAFAPAIVETSKFAIIGALWQPYDPSLYWPVFAILVAVWLVSANAQASKYGAIYDLGWFALACVAALMLAYRLSFVQGPSLLGWSPQIVHESVVIQPVFEALRGGYVYSSVSSQYGGFAQVASVIGNFSADARSATTMLMFAVLALELTAIFLTLRIVGGSSFGAFTGMLATIWFSPVVFTDFTVFQCIQIRWLFPVVFMFLGAVLHAGLGRVAVPLACALVPAAVFWNPETGVASFAAWCSVMLWRVASGFSSWKDLVLQMLGIVIASTAFTGLFFAVSGDLPGISNALKYISVFAQAGFGMLPMNVVHWWNIYALVALGALLFARTLRTHAASGLAWVAGAFCFFLFPYFLGRSYITNLFWIFFPVTMVWSVVGSPSAFKTRKFALVWAIPMLAAASAVSTTPFRWPPTSTLQSAAQASEERHKILSYMQSTVIDKSFATTAIVSPQTYALEELVSAPVRSLPPALAATLLTDQADKWEQYALGAREIFVDDAFFVAGASQDHPWYEHFSRKLQSQFQWNAEYTDGKYRLLHGVRSDQLESAQ
jgi:hypothetical protein